MAYHEVSLEVGPQNALWTGIGDCYVNVLRLTAPKERSSSDSLIFLLLPKIFAGANLQQL